MTYLTTERSVVRELDLTRVVAQVRDNWPPASSDLYDLFGRDCEPWADVGLINRISKILFKIRSWLSEIRGVPKRFLDRRSHTGEVPHTSRD